MLLPAFTLPQCLLLQEDYDGMYSIENTVIVATHTHASAAGYMQYMLYSLTSLGFVPDSFKAMQRGILKVRTTTWICAAPGPTHEP